ncbi:MAG: carboxylating nicotinate-nucleotide diphosphorylase [Fimbriimonadaceae bacterium]
MSVEQGWQPPAPSGWQALLDAELAQDIGGGDLSIHALNPEAPIRWMIEAQATGVACGVGAAAYVLQPCEVLVTDGDAVEDKTVIMRGEAPCGWLLSRERTGLNVLMHLSGVASLTRQYVKAVAGTRARITDTRKTLPGLRNLQKYATRCGGATNHRQGLHDGVMIKDNHIAACGSIAAAVARVRERVGHMVRIEVEADRLEQVEEAVRAGADIVLLDNMSPDTMAQAVNQWGEQVVLEASGGINLGTVRAVAMSGVHVISVGALTHSAMALPYHLELEQ